jgi:hypothetical protein
MRHSNFYRRAWSLPLPLLVCLAFTFTTFGIPGTLWLAMRARTFAT